MKYKMSRTQYVFALLVLQVGLAHSWEIALSVGDELRFYTSFNTISTIRFEHNLTAFAYDGMHNMILYVNKQTNNDTICGYDLSYVEIKCFTERNGRNIHGIAFDPATDKVFFTDTNERSINWISSKPGSVNNPNGNLLIKMDDGVPRDIVVDSCKGYIYWLNTNMAQTTIERARLDGSEREVFKNITPVLRTTTPYLAHSLTLYQQAQTIYWIQPENYTGVTIGQVFRSKLYKNSKTTPILHSRIFRPWFIHLSNTLAASKKKIFFLDFHNVAFKVQLIAQHYDLDRIFYENYAKQIDVGIVANYKTAELIIQGQDCEALESRVITAPESDGPSCVNGTRVNGQSVCKCTPGYSGERCDVSVCENYCLQGNCSFNDEGLPECRCDAGYSGIRCEVNDCHGYCLNDGDCSLNEENEPFCQCVGSYEGARCEANTNDTLTTTSTSCLTGGNLTLADFLSILRKLSSRKFLIVEV